MASTINTNIAAYAAQANIAKATNAATTSVSRLSSGNFITKASDDVARLSIGTSFSTTVRTLKQALVNASQGVSLLQVADGALGQITEILQRQKTLAVQASSGNLSNTDRSFLNQEFQALTDQIDFIASTSSFNGVNLLDGSLSTSSRLNDATKQATAGVATIGFSANLTDGDAITINGLVFTAKDTVANDQQFQIGATAADTAKNLANKLQSLTSSNAATITDSTTTYAQKLGANTYSVENGGTTLTIAARSGGSVSNKFTINASAISTASVSGAYGSSSIALLATNVSAFTDADATVAVASGNTATTPFRVGDALSIKIDDSASISLYTFQAGDSLNDIVNGINASSASTGVSATLTGSSGSGYNIRLNLSRSTGDNVSVSGGANFYKAADGTQTTTLSGATSSVYLLTDSMADAIGATNTSVVENSAAATDPFVTGSFIFASVNGGAYVAITSALGQGDTLEDIVENINTNTVAGGLGMVADIENGNVRIRYADSEQTGAISFFAGTGVGTETAAPTSSNAYNTDALGQRAQAGGLGGSFVKFNLLSTGVNAPDTDLFAAAATGTQPFTDTTGAIAVSINDSATTTVTETYSFNTSSMTLQGMAEFINNQATSIAKGIHASVVQDSGGKYNIQLSYAASALPPAATGGSAVTNGIRVAYTGEHSSLADINTTGALANTSATGSLGSDVDNLSTHRMFTSAFAATLSAGQSVTGASASETTPFVATNTLSVRYNNGAGIQNIVISSALTAGDTLSDIVDKINANTTSGTTHGLIASLDGNGTNILIQNTGTLINSTTASIGTNGSMYFNGGVGFYTPLSSDASDKVALVNNGFNNSYTSVSLFDANVTSDTNGSIVNAAAGDANEPLVNGNLVIQFTAAGATRTATVAITTGMTMDQVADAINNNATAKQYGVTANRTGDSGTTNAVGNISLTFADTDLTGAAPVVFTIANTDSHANLNTDVSGSSVTTVTSLLQRNNGYQNTASTSVGVTSNNVLGLAGGADNGIGYGSTTVTGSVSDALLTALSQKAAQVTIGFPDTDASALSDAFNAKTITVAGTTFTFGTSASSPTDIEIGDSLQETIDNAVSVINKYGKETAIGDAAYQLNQLTVSRSGNNLVFTGKGIGNVTKLDGTALDDIATNVANVSGPTNSGDLNNATRNSTGTFGVDVSAITNAAFTGKISGFSAEYVDANTVNLTVKVGNNTYTATNVNTKPTVGAVGSDALGNQIIRFYSDTYEDVNGKEIGGGFFDVQLAVNQGNTVNNQSDASAFGVRFNSAFQGLSFNQSRSISSYSGTDSVINASGTNIGSLVGSSVSAQLPTFEGNKLTNVSVTAPSAGNVDAEISLIIDGTKYVSRGVGSSLGANQTYKLTSVSNPNNFVNFTTGNTSIDLSTTENANAMEAALMKAFGVDAGSAALSFQIGTKSTESLGVNIGSATTDSLFEGAKLDITTLENAATASAALDAALATVTSIRANVGALQSRFNFASANIQISVQNQDASRSELLDTDIASESTAYATSQVQLQAGISVLAQANQQLQSLLKLLG